MLAYALLKDALAHRALRLWRRGQPYAHKHVETEVAEGIWFRVYDESPHDAGYVELA